MESLKRAIIGPRDGRSTASMILESGQIILNGKYRIDAYVGRGAFAEVYRATHIILQAT